MAQMITGGIDLSVDPGRTGVCELRWDGAGATASFPARADDDALADLLTSPRLDVVGIDVPLGWPEGFARAVARYMAGPEGRWTDTAGPFEDAYFRMRRTDEHARACAAGYGIALNPMSVSADRLGAPAMRAAWLLTRVAREAPTLPIDRSGLRGKVAEVYPAGAVAMWQLPLEPYRNRTRATAEAVLGRCLEQLRTHAGFPIRLEQELRTEHQFDALLCALVARAARTEPPLTVPVPAQLRALARREGWLHLPTPASLPRLVTG